MIDRNVFLRRRKQRIKVKEIIRKEPGFVFILDGRGKPRDLYAVDFPPAEWKKISVGATITSVPQEVVWAWKVEPPNAQKRVKKLIFEVKKKASGLFFIWICEHCGTDYVEYEEGEDPQAIAERVASAHQKIAKPGCERVIRIFDHRGMEQKESEFFLSSLLKVAS